MVSNTEPYVLSLAPAGGPALGGTSVTVLGVALEGVTRVRFGSREVEPSSYLRRDRPAGPVTGLLVRAPAYSAEDEAAAGSQALRTDDPDTLDHTLWKGPAPMIKSH